MSQVQSEAQLEESLIKRLGGLGYDRVTITSDAELRANLKTQLEKHNKITLTDGEFARVMNQLNKGNVFDKAKTLREPKILVQSDDGDPIYINLLNTDHWCQNQYQVTHQVTVEGKYKNRYDVTILINGLPLVQVELKRRGMELKEAFNQIDRYQRQSYWAESGLFQFVQLFVISNGVNTKYFANNHGQGFEQTFFWADAENELITDLDAFADAFMEKCHLSKMICKHIVLHESDKILMVLRPYQYYAVEAILDRVKAGRKNGYIWHTTGSGKTLTSFKAAQVLIELPKVDKVVFVVDRADLDYQTTKEFNHFSDGSVDGTDNTKALVDQLSSDRKLIVTTIQKLNTAIGKDKYDTALQAAKDQRVVFVFDECHRSQFGKTHKAIVDYFANAQMFGFTGTPILKENAVGKQTTESLFDKCLHTYVITNAIADRNVLRFSVDYWGKLKRKDGSLIDDDVAGIDVKEFFENPDRIEKVVDWIIANHGQKTYSREFSAMFCVSSVDALVKYYDIFQRKKLAGEHDLRIATIFTFGANEAEQDDLGEVGETNFTLGDASVNKDKRDKLEGYIADYNGMYGTNYSTRDKSFYDYYKDIGKRIKAREKKDFQDKDRVDILLVVNMFLTGFDAKKLNTLYVDKNLKYHGLIQAFSRTNRTFKEKKSHGNIVCFRNLKAKTDEAIALFSNKDAEARVLLEPYETYVEEYNDAVAHLLNIAPTVESVDKLISEDDRLAFVLAFRELMRIKNTIKTFAEFSENDLDLTAQDFESYSSKYLDIKDAVKPKEVGDKESIIDAVDFELELIQRDEINVTYILALLADVYELENSLDQNQRDEGAKKRKLVLDTLNTEVRLRSKRELIEEFIDGYLPSAGSGADVSAVFTNFWDDKKQQAVAVICEAEGLRQEAFVEMLGEYHYTGKLPLRDTIVSGLHQKPKIMERKSIVQRITDKILAFTAKFDDGMGDF